jgi:type IV secretion system protein VirB9
MTMKNAARTLLLTGLAGVVAVSAVMAFPATAFALKDSKPIASDRRIRTVVYNDNEIYKFVGHYDYQSVIEFESDEEVLTVSMGNSVTWQVVPAGNRMFIKPVQQDAMTNMTVITNKRTYHFELHAEEANNINDPDMVFVLRFIYGRGAGIAVSNYMDSVPDPMLDPEKYNFNYVLSGAEEISPVRIFDDGQFTYFEFRDKNAEIPGFFLVHGDGSESLINFRTRGDYIVVERVAAQFTLRHGQDIVCIFNQNMGLSTSGATPRSIKSKKWYQFGDDDHQQEAPPVPKQGAQGGSGVKR